MSLEVALRASEILLALALIQQSAEHLVRPPERPLHGARLALAVLLLTGLAPAVALAGLAGLSLALLARYDGVYNGGADRMALLLLWCLLAARLAPSAFWAELALAYLAVQVTLSYVISGKVKLENPDWRSGAALRDVFAFSAYPVTEGYRDLAAQPALLTRASWAVIGFELAFPLALLSQPLFLLFLLIGAGFHAANAVLFGLNRFLWVWVATYPVLIWFQARLWTAPGM